MFANCDVNVSPTCRMPTNGRHTPIKQLEAPLSHTALTTSKSRICQRHGGSPSQSRIIGGLE